MKHSNRDKNSSSTAKTKSAVPPTQQTPSKQDPNDPRRAADGRTAPASDSNKPGIIVASSNNKQDSGSAQK